MMLTAIKRWIKRLFGAAHGPERFTLAVCDDLPEAFRARTIYAIGESGTYWQAAFLCPCGCGSLIQLPLTPDARPRWLLSIADGNPTLKPSVWRTVGCKSHFFIRGGHVHWAKD